MKFKIKKIDYILFYIINVQNVLTIAQTYKEKKEIINYYDNIRKQMEIIKEEFDEKQENEYNNKVIKRIKEYKIIFY